jgi:hypothetical protein
MAFEGDRICAILFHGMLESLFIEVLPENPDCWRGKLLVF